MWKIKLSYIGYSFGNERDKNNEIKKTCLFIFFILKIPKNYSKTISNTYLFHGFVPIFLFYLGT
jgi:hypothetical protein